jgi:hypothetical protein
MLLILITIVLAVVVAEAARKDSLDQGFNNTTAWFVGLIAGAVSFVFVAVIIHLLGV